MAYKLSIQKSNGVSMFTDYKFWYIRRDDDGVITEAAVRFYEGNYQNVEVEVEPGRKELQNRYVRTKRLNPSELDHLGSKKKAKESSGQEIILYTPEDFGKIKTDDELREFLNKELAKDTIREAIEGQGIQIKL